MTIIINQNTNTDNTAGFYNTEWQDDSTVILIYARNFVYNRDYQLLAEQHDTYTYPVAGWRWFDSEAQAREYFGLPSAPTDEEQQ